jgi:hypothetical protein
MELRHHHHQNPQNMWCSSGIGTASLVSTIGNHGGGYINIGEAPIAESSSCLMHTPVDSVGIPDAQTGNKPPISSMPRFTVLTGKKSTETGEGYAEAQAEEKEMQ